jgi:hypothetical protein
MKTVFTLRLIGISMNYHISTLKAFALRNFQYNIFIFIYSGNGGSHMSEYVAWEKGKTGKSFNIS